MPLAASTSYPLLSAFWTIFEIFAFVVWFWLLFVVLTDVFRSSDLSGWAKAAWTIFVLFLPLIGILVYLIVRGPSMHERAARQASQQDEAFRKYVQEAAGSSPSSADQLAKLADLRQRGVISADEFEREKTRVLASRLPGLGRATRPCRVVGDSRCCLSMPCLSPTMPGASDAPADRPPAGCRLLEPPVKHRPTVATTGGRWPWVDPAERRAA